MPAFEWPDFSDEKVLCQEPCDHPDCAANRKMAEMACQLCAESFTPGQRYIMDRQGEAWLYTHVLCECKRMDAAGE